jgi:hypothetical protein
MVEPQKRMGSASWLSLLFVVTLLAGCGADAQRPDAAGDAIQSRPELADDTADYVRPETDSIARDEGVLAITARSALQRRLDTVHYVVKNAAGDVVAGGDDEAANGGAQDRELSLVLPAAEGMQLELSATTADGDASQCTASVGPFSIEAGSRASFQVFVWRCDGAPGAAGPEPECYWLADWIGVTRTRAAVGDRIGLTAAGHDARGEPARFKWSTPSPELGRFDDEDAAETSFRCATASAALPLGLAMSDGQCHKAFSELVACQ